MHPAADADTAPACLQTQLTSQAAAQDRVAQAEEAHRLAALQKAADDEFAHTLVAKDNDAVVAHQGDRVKQRQAANETAAMLDTQVSPFWSERAVLMSSCVAAARLPLICVSCHMLVAKDNDAVVTHQGIRQGPSANETAAMLDTQASLCAAALREAAQGLRPVSGVRACCGSSNSCH